MSLDLDTRQRAMLREMGVHVWLPEAPAPMADAASASGLALNAIEEIAVNAINTRAIGLNILESPVTAQAAELAHGLVPGRLPADAPDAVAHDKAAAAALSPAVLPAPPVSAASQEATPAVASSRVATPGRQPAAVARTPAPTTVTALPQAIDRMAWPQLSDAVTHCQACAMCFGRRAPVLAVPEAPTPCDWLVVGDPPDEAQERLGLPFVEEAGLLLDNMLRAVGVQRFLPGAELDGLPEKRAYLTHVLKCRPELMRAPDATELATCANYLRREIALTQPKVILAMGRFAMQVLLGDTPPESAKLPLGKLRGQVWQFAGVPLVVTYPPAYLLRSGQDKGKAWADLCLALDVAQGKAPTPLSCFPPVVMPDSIRHP